MPNIKSAIKRVAQDEKRTARNRVRKERLKKAIKGFSLALTSKDSAAIDAAFKKALNAVDKAGDKGLLHANNVNRKKSWLARQINKAVAVKA